MRAGQNVFAIIAGAKYSLYVSLKQKSITAAAAWRVSSVQFLYRKSSVWTEID